MMPDPLHPAVIHFPIVLMIALPAVVWMAFRALRDGEELRRAWTRVVIGALALTGVSWFALETGVNDAEAVEAVISEATLSAHANTAALFLGVSGLVSLLALAGLMKERAGVAARYVTAGGAVVLLLLGARVGHTGGELVYEYGAASAYIVDGRGAPSQLGAAGAEDHDGDRRQADDDDGAGEEVRGR